MLLAALLAFACGGRATEPAAATSAPRPPDAPQPEAIAAVEPEPAPAAEPEPAEPAPPKDPLAPLSAEQKATLWAGDADTLAPTSIHYVKSNEIRHDVWFPYIDGIGGAYVGVGSDQNYTVIAAARAELVFLLDIDQRVVDLHRIYEVLIEASEDPETLRERFNKDNAEESIALLDAAFADLDEAEQRRLRNDYRYSRETVFRHLRTVISRDRAGKPTSWLSDPAMYAHIRKLYQSDRVRMMGGDLTGANAVLTAGKAAAALGYPVRVVYLSNAEEYFKYTDQYRANIAGLAGDEQSVVLRTIYSKEWIHADMLWAYQVQRLADFQRRLEIPENRSRNPMFKIAEQAGELDKETGVKGLSLLGADLKEPAELVAVAGDAVD